MKPAHLAGEVGEAALVRALGIRDGFVVKIIAQRPGRLHEDAGIKACDACLLYTSFTEIDFTDFDDAIGPCVMMMFTAFTGNITNGLGAGIIVHVLVKLVRGKAKEIHPIMYLLCALMVLYFIVG